MRARAPAVEPLSAAEFAAAMTALGPFEKSPRLAVAVSGGADSMALLLLAAEWASAHGGEVFALTVDHGLRPEAAAEARQVGTWAADLAITHHVLHWTGPKPRRDIQAAARSARYRLLEGWCAGKRVLHLLLAHHQDDQAETFLLRLARGSGLDGLAAMSPVVERPACRLLRPLLAIPRTRLHATATTRGAKWLDDPSNRNEKFARVRLRGAAAVLAREGLDAPRLAETAMRLARARAALERSIADLLARAAMPDPAGFIGLDPVPLRAVAEEIGLRALAALLMAVAGAEYPPRLARLERLYRDVIAGLRRGRTLGGCRVVPHRGILLICREPKAVSPPVHAEPGAAVEWDGRFRLSLEPGAPPGLTLGALGSVKIAGAGRSLPGAARIGAAALRDGDGILAVPALGYCRDHPGTTMYDGHALLLRTSRPATGAGVKVV